jgi:hypothetical protein
MHDSYAREMTTKTAARMMRVPRQTVICALKRRAYCCVQPTFKPGLKAVMRAARLDFALAHRHWTLRGLEKSNLDGRNEHYPRPSMVSHTGLEASRRGDGEHSHQKEMEKGYRIYFLGLLYV